MGRKKREIPPWSSAEIALAECKRLLGTERCATVQRGLRRQVRFPKRLHETVALWESMKALGPGLRRLKKTIGAAWAIERGRTIPALDLDETVDDAYEEWLVYPVGSYAVRDLIGRLKPWLGEWDELLAEANRIKPEDTSGTEEIETTAMARYFVSLDRKGEQSITKQIAALLEVANGRELPGGSADERATAWESRLEKWKKALARARTSVSQRHSPRERVVGRKSGGDNRPAKPASVPRK